MREAESRTLILHREEADGDGFMWRKGVCVQICSARETADSIFLENSQHLSHTFLIQQGCGLASCSCVSQTAQAEEAHDGLTPPS